MTLPGADTMKGGIMGDDCFRFMAGAIFGDEGTAKGILEANCGRAESTGECSGVCVVCDVERCWTVTAVVGSAMGFKIVRPARTHGARRSRVCECCR